MDYMIINHKEISALNGLPFIQRLVYLQGIRPYVDYQTCIVGLKRGISYQSISEVLYVEPHPGIQSGSPSKDQLRRAIKGLEKAGLLEIHSSDKKLIFKCLLVEQPYSVRNKVATKPHHQETCFDYENKLDNSISCDEKHFQSTMSGMPKAAIPHKEINSIYLLGQFEKFWSIYPEKKSKQQAWEAFQALNPDEALFNQIIKALFAHIEYREAMIANGLWVPPWKFPANWLTKRSWEDDLTMEPLQEKTHHASYRHNSSTSRAKDPFWKDGDSLDDFLDEPDDKRAAEPEDESSSHSNILAFKRKTHGTY